MGDGTTVGSEVAAAVIVVVGGTVAETVSPAVGVGRAGTAVAACAETMGRWETAVVTCGMDRDCEQAASNKASKMRAGIAAVFLIRFSLVDDNSSVGDALGVVVGKTVAMEEGGAVGNGLAGVGETVVGSDDTTEEGERERIGGGEGISICKMVGKEDGNAVGACEGTSVVGRREGTEAIDGLEGGTWGDLGSIKGSLTRSTPSPCSPLAMISN